MPVIDSNRFSQDINDITKRGTLFENVIFGEVIRKAFFRLHSQSMGIKYAAYFNEDGGIPLVTLALVATTVSNLMFNGFLISSFECLTGSLCH